MNRAARVLPIERPVASHRGARHGVAIILASSLLFGAMAVCVRLSAREMTVPQIAFLRFLGSLSILLAFRRGRSLQPQPGNRTRVLLRGLLGGAAILLYYRGIAGAGAGLATMLHCTYPVFTALLATAFLGERLDARLATALAMSIAGVFAIFGPGVEMSPRVLDGAVSALGASVLAGGAVAAAGHLRRTESAYLVTTYFMAVGTVLSSPAILLGMPVWNAALAAAVLGVVLTSVGGQTLLHLGLGFASPTQASLAAATSVVSAAVFEALFLGENLGSGAIAGAALLIGAVALAAGRR